jgi:hypothetical protein
VHPSSETAIIDALLDKGSRYGTIETVLLDAGYFCHEVIEHTQTRGIELLCPEGRSEGKGGTQACKPVPFRRRTTCRPKPLLHSPARGKGLYMWHGMNSWSSESLR